MGIGGNWELGNGIGNESESGIDYKPNTNSICPNSQFPIPNSQLPVPLSALSILLIAPFDDSENAHSAQRARAFERLGCDVTTFDLQRRPGLLGRLAGSDLRSRLLKSLEV